MRTPEQTLIPKPIAAVRVKNTTSAARKGYFPHENILRLAAKTRQVRMSPTRPQSVPPKKTAMPVSQAGTIKYVTAAA